MANTYVLISSSTVGASAVSAITFSSIPATYTDLLLKTSLRTDLVATFTTGYIKFNNVTTNLSAKVLQGSGAAASSFSLAGFFHDLDSASNTASVFSSVDIYIPNYASANYKSYSVDAVQEQNGTTAYAELTAGLWSDTTAINRIDIYPQASNFVQYSTAYLYGIKNS